MIQQMLAIWSLVPLPFLSAGGCNWRTKHRQEEPPHIRGQGQKPEGPHARRAAAKRSYPMSKVRGSGKSARPRRRRNGGEELPRIQGQGRRPGGANPHPWSRGCAGAGEPRGAIPPLRSGRAAVRRYHSSKVRSNGCALLEQPWRDTPRPR